ncbi:hypothetical protein FKW77_009125 [Venturia effusa]|uniref:Uncharacterized protein n=1 Tax=Venturia effusa TaxID=50376 RepID=A0A517LBK3_9PEZI|nr:hypothetical protein FKW77_009125 [Venturia effusa]
MGARQIQHKKDLDLVANNYQEQMSDELQNQKNIFQRHIDQLVGENARLEEETLAAEATHENILSVTQERHNLELYNMSIEHQEELQHREIQLNNLMATHSQILKTQNTEHEQAMSQKTIAHTNELRAREQAYARLVDEHSSSIDDFKANHTSAINMLNFAHSSAIQSLKLAHDQERQHLNTKISTMEAEHEIAKKEAMKDLKKDNEAFKKALVAREKARALPDHQIADNFRSLALDIDEFSSFDWDRRAESSWPFPSNSFHKPSIAPIHIKIERQIIQTKIWILLYNHIFLTPFRIFGEEGKKLESKWAGTSPTGRNLEWTGWPKAIEGSETRRCIEVKKCIEAIDKGTTPALPGYRLREAYHNSLANLANEMAKVVGTVSPVDDNALGDMKEIANSAARFWLELGSQRFRVFVAVPDRILRSMQGSSGRGAQRGLVELVIRPELRRAGNSLGGGLGREEVISECTGEYSSFQSG